MINRITKLLAFAITLSFSNCTPAGSSSMREGPLNKLPNIVKSEIAEMTSVCRQVEGKPRTSPDFLLIADINGDKISDYVINPMGFNCIGAESLFSGSAGTIIEIYIGTTDGQARKAFMSTAHDVELDMSTKPAKIRMLVEGALCGQKLTSETAHVDYKACWRPVLWNGSKQRLEFAPLSQVDFSDFE